MLSLIRSGPLRLYLPTHLPSERLMLSAPLAAPSPQRYYAGSDSCRASYTTRQASPVHPLAFWTCHPQPRRAPGTSRALPPRASGRLVAEPGFAETLGSSPLHAAESGSYSYSLPIRLQLLPTPSRSDATTLPLERRSCFQLYVRQLHTVRTHTVLTNELTDALGHELTSLGASWGRLPWFRYWYTQEPPQCFVDWSAFMCAADAGLF